MAGTDAREPSLRERWRRARWLSAMVSERARFTARELVPRAGTHSYRLRDDGVTMLVRHRAEGGSRDPWVLHEVVRGGDYELPPEIAASLPESPRVVDLGANVGYFTLRLLKRVPGARVVAFEPDTSNLVLLRDALRRNGVEGRVEVVEACAATDDGWIEFLDGRECESRVVFDGEDAATTRARALDVFPYLEGVDLLKIDIEGSEWDLLADPRFAQARPHAIVLEWHSWQCPADNAKRFVTDRLMELGYEVRHAQPDAAPDFEPFWGAGVVWARSAG